MDMSELSRIIVKKEKKIEGLKAILIAHRLYDEVEKIE